MSTESPNQANLEAPCSRVRVDRNFCRLVPTLDGEVPYWVRLNLVPRIGPCGSTWRLEHSPVCSRSPGTRTPPRYARQDRPRMPWSACFIKRSRSPGRPDGQGRCPGRSCAPGPSSRPVPPEEYRPAAAGAYARGEIVAVDQSLVEIEGTRHAKRIHGKEDPPHGRSDAAQMVSRW